MKFAGGFKTSCCGNGMKPNGAGKQRRSGNLSNHTGCLCLSSSILSGDGEGANFTLSALGTAFLGNFDNSFFWSRRKTYLITSETKPPLPIDGKWAARKKRLETFAVVRGFDTRPKQFSFFSYLRSDGLENRTYGGIQGVLIQTEIRENNRAHCPNLRL